MSLQIYQAEIAPTRNKVILIDEVKIKINKNLFPNISSIKSRLLRNIEKSMKRIMEQYNVVISFNRKKIKHRNQSSYEISMFIRHYRQQFIEEVQKVVISLIQTLFQNFNINIFPEDIEIIPVNYKDDTHSQNRVTHSTQSSSNTTALDYEPPQLNIQETINSTVPSPTVISNSPFNHNINSCNFIPLTSPCLCSPLQEYNPNATSYINYTGNYLQSLNYQNEMYGMYGLNSEQVNQYYLLNTMNNQYYLPSTINYQCYSPNIINFYSFPQYVNPVSNIIYNINNNATTNMNPYTTDFNNTEMNDFQSTITPLEDEAIGIVQKNIEPYNENCTDFIDNSDPVDNQNIQMEQELNSQNTTISENNEELNINSDHQSSSYFIPMSNSSFDQWSYEYYRKTINPIKKFIFDNLEKLICQDIQNCFTAYGN